MSRILLFACLATACNVLHATVIDTDSTATAAAFQTGLNVLNFDSVAARTPKAISSYPINMAGNPGDPINSSAFIFDQFTGVKFSVGGNPGTNMPALYELTGNIAKDAHSKPTVLGPVDFDGTTKFNSGALMEIFFPTKVSKVGFWLNGGLGNVLLIAADNNPAFTGVSGEDDFETETVTAGHFVGIQRSTADIGALKIIALGTSGFTIDDFSYAR